MDDKQANRRAWWKQWREKNKERLREAKRVYQRRYYEKNREKILAKQGIEYREYQRAYYQATKLTQREKRLFEKFGLLKGEWEAILAAQGGACAICRTTDPRGLGTKFHVDHCHATGKVRGLLCSTCNVLLGHAKDSEAILSSAIAYLQRTKDSG